MLSWNRSNSYATTLESLWHILTSIKYMHLCIAGVSEATKLVACLPTVEMVTSGAWRVCSMSGDGGGRASWIYRGWRWLVVGASVSGDYLSRTKCWGKIWLPVVEPDASLAVACGGPVSWPKCSGGSPVGGAVSVGVGGCCG
jgi:hypothetical protein